MTSGIVATAMACSPAVAIVPMLSAAPLRTSLMTWDTATSRAEEGSTPPNRLIGSRSTAQKTPNETATVVRLKVPPGTTIA